MDIFTTSVTLNCFLSLSQIRLLTLRILSQFEAELPPQAEVRLRLSSNLIKYRKMCLFVLSVCPSVQGEENVEVQPVFAVCLQAELVPASVQDYREKLLHLRKLRHDLVQRSLPQGPAATFQQVHRKHSRLLLLLLLIIWKLVTPY